MRIDLNCDLGEGGSHDAALMPLVTSANIACGGHAGDRETMRVTLELARRHGVAAGAHPGFADRAHFGRHERALAPPEVTELVRSQVEALRALGPITHVKPHGALYTQSARERPVADAIAEAVASIDPNLMLVGQAGSLLLRAGAAWGLRVVSEVFADRTYQRDGSLTPRACPDALITAADAAAAQVLRMIREGVVEATDGTLVPVRADSICVHGDGPHAVALARRLRTELADAGVAVQPFAS